MSSSSPSLTCLPAVAVSKEEGLIAFSVGSNIHIFDKSLQKELLNHKLEKANVKSLLFEGKYFIVASSEDKSVLVFLLNDTNTQLKCVGKIELVKKPSCLAVHPVTKELWIGDKFGDVYAVNLLSEFDANCASPKLIKKPAPKMGHLAMLTGLILNEKYIITSDRDEKIRITNYPEYFLVHNFCLGHTEMVSCISLADDDLLVSASTDSTLKVWKYLLDSDDALKYSYDCGENNYPNVLQCVTIGSTKLVFVLYEQADYIQVLQLDTETCELVPKITIPMGSEILNFLVYQVDNKTQITLLTASSPNVHVADLSVKQSGDLSVNAVPSHAITIESFQKEDFVSDSIYSSLIRKMDAKKSENEGEDKQPKKKKNKK
ncbi:hypothetical protein C9374_004888 [Naegleria lovaniensis]|uniref:tRNA (guanine-N(7)-)-methyltransferase non-catalytic subunit n=1 Tax=Naegleria lovaniensis TaxID=51637 RepID=A0AA88GL07_NAELO|nr:uncharacterized protein C9374_004888 [Naegleria lovaniensis]KAG2382921.1 hypothetical protein C9374_004888 [Naegleria lovaniensis]